MRHCDTGDGVGGEHWTRRIHWTGVQMLMWRRVMMIQIRIEIRIRIQIQIRMRMRMRMLMRMMGQINL